MLRATPHAGERPRNAPRRIHPSVWGRTSSKTADKTAHRAVHAVRNSARPADSCCPSIPDGNGSPTPVVRPFPDGNGSPTPVVRPFPDGNGSPTPVVRPCGTPNGSVFTLPYRAKQATKRQARQCTALFCPRTLAPSRPGRTRTVMPTVCTGSKRNVRGGRIDILTLKGAATALVS
jgi:hypothetical protein